ncbi:GNAT family N-acetyltransferase [Nonomuraea gerenzanensis]|uniref:GCN5-related N-acetyltransferase n=1 Tax=Nonomuraea gerenzanensis TaxID=93944 RepID=A0A1M4DWT5_9ACTN|nr:GNAT family N-acetyltransferase [Nonomuraea gerenzanensis]UBU13375.1 GNAT family N-acetyltransferase [Nonomuraea gerenzanensis]SBO91034.1 GCN5-related N-acetyltransferase [Nonomuraea gerenzanensis]
MQGTQIRPARPDDEERIRRFLAGLSLHTQTLRFFTGVSKPAPGLVRTLLCLDERRDALVATTACGEIVAHAMSFRSSSTDVEADGEADVEIAVVVADEWQGRGLGPRLVDTLLLRASVRGARTVGMDVLGENRRVLRLIRRLWPDATMKVASGSVEVTAMIDQAGLFAEQGSVATPLTV